MGAFSDRCGRAQSGLVCLCGPGVLPGGGFDFFWQWCRWRYSVGDGGGSLRAQSSGKATDDGDGDERFEHDVDAALMGSSRLSEGVEVILYREIGGLIGKDP